MHTDARNSANSLAQPQYNERSSMTGSNSTRARKGYLRFVVEVGIFSALLATVAAALTIAFLGRLRDHSFPNPLDFVEAVLLLCPITVVSCGSFGFVAGIFGGTTIYLRRKHIHSSRRLLFESSLAGFLLGCTYPVFDGAVNSSSLIPLRLWMTPIQVIIAVVLSVLCALICALSFRKHITE